MRIPTAVAEIIGRRTYHRPLDMDDETKGFETWDQVIDRVISHQRWLWARAQTLALTSVQEAELEELRDLMLDRAALCSGRTLWLGGTDIARRREASMFNCAFLEVETISDVVDSFWLLLQGCGVGFRPVPGALFSFPTVIPTIKVVDSNRRTKGGKDTNVETWEPLAKRWTIQVGDSAEAWAKAVGKLFAGKYYGCEELVLDFSQIRPEGKRLKGYGWICHGFRPLAFAMAKIAEILNQHPNKMLSFAQIHECVNLLGTVLSSRRSAQLALCNASAPWAKRFASFKSDLETSWWKSQSNNTLNFFFAEPPVDQINEFFDIMVATGGSEPGFRNGLAGLKRAPWSKGTNPCAEILLPNKGFCNLVEINVSHPRFQKGKMGALMHATRLIARANYRQTCVNLRDGILQNAWHENNANLRLCGVGLTGITACPQLTAEGYSLLRKIARDGADSMALELGLSKSAAVTTVKPSGTLGKVMDCPNGFHQPLARFIFNRVSFGPHDPMIPLLREAGYKLEPHPVSAGSYLAVLPIDYGVDFKQETAIEQLDRYKSLMQHWCDHNVSCTIYYEPDEIEAIKKWIADNWDDYVAVSFLPRTPNTTYSYYPQTAVTKEEYSAYASQLRPIDFGSLGLLEDERDNAGGVPQTPSPNSECAGGACPIR